MNILAGDCCWFPGTKTGALCQIRKIYRKILLSSLDEASQQVPFVTFVAGSVRSHVQVAHANSSNHLLQRLLVSSTESVGKTACKCCFSAWHLQQQFCHFASK